MSVGHSVMEAHPTLESLVSTEEVTNTGTNAGTNAGTNVVTNSDINSGITADVPANECRSTDGLTVSSKVNSSSPNKNSPENPPRLVDSFGRHIHYLRLSLTDRCNLRCNYCMADDMQFVKRSQTLTDDEIVTVAHAFCGLGIDKIRLTGGEPLIRPGVIPLIKRLKPMAGLKTLALSTNGILLSDMAEPLAAAGIDELNISLDTLQPDRFKTITRIGQLDQVLAGIDAATQAGFRKVKLNAVAMQGVNDDELVELAAFAVDHGLDISFIEEMPLGDITSHQRQDTEHASARILDRLRSRYHLAPSDYVTAGPSRYFQLPERGVRIGFISPMSNNFCDDCNRVRVSAEGRLLLCLGHEEGVDLRSLLRKPGTQIEDIQHTIRQAMPHKPARHPFNDDVQVLRFMNMTGG